jgi:hypothetical protein
MPKETYLSRKSSENNEIFIVSPILPLHTGQTNVDSLNSLAVRSAAKRGGGEGHLRSHPVSGFYGVSSQKGSNWQARITYDSKLYTHLSSFATKEKEAAALAYDREVRERGFADRAQTSTLLPKRRLQQPKRRLQQRQSPLRELPATSVNPRGTRRYEAYFIMANRTQFVSDNPGTRKDAALDNLLQLGLCVEVFLRWANGLFCRLAHGQTCNSCRLTAQSLRQASELVHVT